MHCGLIINGPANCDIKWKEETVERVSRIKKPTKSFALFSLYRFGMEKYITNRTDLLKRSQKSALESEFIHLSPKII